MIFAEGPSQRDALVKQLLPVARRTQQIFTWLVVDPTQHPSFAEKVAVQETGAWPAFGFVDKKYGPDEDDFRYAFPTRGDEAALTTEAIEKVLDDYKYGKLERTIRSEAVPSIEENAKEVGITAFVADNYDAVIHGAADQDVLVLYYSPTCGHCKKMEPAYEQLGALLQSLNDKVLVAKINAKGNDVSPPVTSFPTLKYFAAGAKEAPVKYSGNRTLEDFLRFIKESASEGTREALQEVKVLDILAGHDEL